MTTKNDLRFRATKLTTTSALACAATCAVMSSGCSLDQFRKDPVYANAANTCEALAMIDDAEDRNDQVLVRERRGGYIYTFVDTAGSTVQPGATGFKMDKPGANGSRYAIHVQGKLAASGETYAGVGLDLRNPRTGYDASKYKGISFLAKSGGGGVAHVAFSVPDVNTDPDGKVCTECFNNFGIGVDLTEEWTRFEVPFTELKQQAGWGTPRPDAIDVRKLISLQWQVTAPGSSFDFWIDDVSFIGGCP